MLSQITVVGMLVGHQLPGRQPRALQKRPRLVGVNMNPLALLDRRANHAQRRPVPAGRQRAGVAVRQHAALVGQQRSAVGSHRLAGGNVCLVHRVRLGQQDSLDLVEGCAFSHQSRKDPLHAVDGPERDSPPWAAFLPAARRSARTPAQTRPPSRPSVRSAPSATP